MTCFIDTSALLAIVDEADVNHAKAKKQWDSLLDQEEKLITTNYILVEAVSVIQRRHGMHQVRRMQELLQPIVQVEWVDSVTHDAGVFAMVRADRRQLSLVDCISFIIMRRTGTARAFAFDRHFAEEGLECLPGDGA